MYGVTARGVSASVHLPHHARSLSADLDAASRAAIRRYAERFSISANLGILSGKFQSINS